METLGLLTHFVRSLSAEGTPPDQQLFDRVWKLLRGALYRELCRRGLWSRPPKYLGVLGSGNWASTTGDDALDELVADFYSYSFIDRLASLLAQAELRANIDGLVFRNVANFVHDRQKHHDPLGRRVFSLTRRALEGCISEGQLVLLQGETLLDYQSLLGFPKTLLDTDPHDSRALEELTSPWVEVLLPDLVTSRGPGVTRVIDRLRELVLSLEQAGVHKFSLGSLVLVLRNAIRRQWQSIAEFDTYGASGVEGTENQRVPTVLPDSVLENQETFARLIECVEARLDALNEGPLPEAAVAGTRATWELLVDWSRGIESQLDAEKPPSQRRIASFLEISRRQVREQLDILQGAVRECREPSTDSPLRVRGETMGRATKEDLRQATGQARSRLAEALPATGSESHPASGSIYALPASSHFPVEWLVLGPAEPSSASLRVLPVDDHPLLGSGELKLKDEVSGASMSVRGRPLLLHRGLFEGAVMTRRLAGEALDRARTLEEARRADESSAPAHDPGDPEYREWIEYTLTPAVESLEWANRSADAWGKVPPASTSESRTTPWLLALAAVFSLAALGLAMKFWQDTRDLRLLDHPRSAPASALILLGDEFRKPEPWQLSPRQHELILDLILRQPYECEDFDVELLDAEGSVLWVFENLAFEENRERIVLPRPFLEKDPEQLRLLGFCDQKRTSLQSLPLSLRISASPDAVP